MKINRLQKQHVDQVARLHIRCLRTRFEGASGERLLRSYYSAVAEGRGACGYVAAGEDNQVIGFVCGVWDAGLVRRIMVKKHFPALVWNALAQGLARPTLLLELLKRLLRPEAPDEQPGAAGYELRPIVVAAEARGSSAARLLVSALLQDAAARKFPSVYLVTEADNLPARTFYRKVGFNEMGKITRDGSSYFWYERSTAGPV